jgi:hypothetical protein
VAANPYDDLYRRELSEAAGVNAVVEAPISPVEAARSARLARRFGAPPPLVQRDPGGYEAQEEAEQVRQATRNDPQLAAFYSQPGNAALARGDAFRLSGTADLLFRRVSSTDAAAAGRRIGTVSSEQLAEFTGRSQVGLTSGPPLAFQPGRATDANTARYQQARAAEAFANRRPDEQRIPGTNVTFSAQRGAEGAARLAAGTVLSAAHAGMSLIQAADEQTFGAGSAEWWQSRQERAERIRRDVRPDWLSPTQSYLYGMLESTAQTAAVLPVTGASLPLGLTTFGLWAGGDAYGRYRLRGATPNEALAGAAFVGAAEAGIEAATGGLSALLRGPTSGVRRWFTDYAVREMGGELLTTTLQNIPEEFVGNPNGSWSNYLDELPRALLDTAVSTAFTTGVMGGARALGPRQVERRLREVQEGVDQQQHLDALVDVATQSEMRKRDPESFREYIDQRVANSNTPVREVFVPIEALEAYYQSENIDPEEAQFFEPYQAQIEEAQRTRGDVVIPIGDVLARLAGAKAWETIREEVRLTQGGISGREAREGGERILQQLEDAAKATGVDTTSEAAPGSVIAERVKNELLAIGRSSREAEAVSTLFAARRVAAAERLGITPEEYEKLRPITFQREGAAKKGRKKAAAPAAEAEQTVEQDILPGEGWAEQTVGGLIDAHEGKWALNGEIVAEGTESAIEVSWKNRDALLAMGKTFFQSPDAFWNWFGQSKVVDADGVPLVVYHGSAAQFDAFRPGPVHRHGHGKQMAAVYFSPRKSVAQAYARTASNAADASSDGPGVVVAAYLSIQNPRIFTDVGEFANADRVELEAAGHDGAFRLNDQGDLVEIAVFEPTQIKSTANSGAFDPANPNIYRQGPRGQAELGDDRAIITLFGTADRSTLVHELGHVFLNELMLDAALPNAPQELKEDAAKVRTWVAANGHEIKKGAIPRDGHELWARGFERYLMEGKAPSKELQDVFRRFADWMTGIYKTVQRLNSPISPEIREVMDRLLATSEAIETMTDETARPLFATAEEAGMSEAEFAAYRRSIENAKDEAYGAMLNRAMKLIRDREKERMRAQRSNIRADAASKINSQPEMIALHLLRTGRWLGDPDREATPVKLNTGWLIDTYGEDILTRLPKGLPIAHGAGVEGDVAAEMVGMPSGDALVKALLALREASDALRASGETRSYRDTLIEAEVEREMGERHGDMMTDEDIEAEAIAAVNTASQGEVIAAELNQLRKRDPRNGAQTPYQLAREWARRVVLNGTVNDVASRHSVQRYIRATNKAMKAAEEAILAGDTAEAFRQKQAQMLNHALLAEAKATANTVEEIVGRMNRLAKQAARKSVDQDYMDKAHDLLENFDFRPRSQRALDEIESFDAWAAKQIDQGLEVYVPSRLVTNGRHYSRVTVAELIELNDAVQSLLHLGRVKQKLRDAQGERDFIEFRDEVLGHIAQRPDRKMPDSPINEETRYGAGAAAPLLKVETLADELDNGNPNGPLNRLLVQGASAAATKRDDLTDKVIAPIAKLYLGMSKAYRQRLMDKVTIPELMWNAVRETDPRRGQPVTMTRGELLAVALNTGNVSNLEKMAKGEGWPAATIQRVLQREMSKEDWDFVQSVWSGVDQLWPDIVEVERELSGIVPEQVTPLEVETPFGPYQGGYWPVVYDGSRSTKAEQREIDNADDLFGFRSGVATSKGHTIARTEASGPLRYNLEEILLSHLERVTTRIAYAPWIREVLKVVNNKKIAGAIDTKLGPEYRRQILPWLRRQVTGNLVDKRGAGWWDGLLRKFRTNMSIMTMGFAYSTGIAQSLGLGFSAGRIGSKYVAIGLRKTLGSAGITAGLAGAGGGALASGGWLAGIGGAAAALGTAKSTGSLSEAEEFVFSRSPEMARRNQEMNREVVEVFRKLKGKHGWYSNAQAMAFWHIGMIDRYVVAMPTWLGAHQKGLDEGMTDAEASAYGDKMVRTSQGSGHEKDLAAVQSPNSEAFKFLVLFYTPFNVMFNAQWESVRAAKSGDWRKSMQLTAWFLVATTLADAMMSGDWPEDEEQDGIAEDMALWFGRNVFFGLWSGIPLLRDAAGSGERLLRDEFATFGQTPISNLLTTGWRAGEQTYDVAFESEEVTGRYIKTLSQTAGAALGLPGGQFGKTAGFLWDVNSGTVDPETVRDWYSGITSGKVPEPTSEE